MYNTDADQRVSQLSMLIYVIWIIKSLANFYCYAVSVLPDRKPKGQFSFLLMRLILYTCMMDKIVSGYRAAYLRLEFVFTFAKSKFSHDVSHIIKTQPSNVCIHVR